MCMMCIYYYIFIELNYSYLGLGLEFYTQFLQILENLPPTEAANCHERFRSVSADMSHWRRGSHFDILDSV